VENTQHFISVGLMGNTQVSLDHLKREDLMGMPLKQQIAKAVGEFVFLGESFVLK